MSFSYGFFNAKNMDRTYTAEDFTSYLSSIICNGVFDTYGDCFSVTAGTGTSVVIGTGKAWIEGHYFINDTAYTLDLTKYVDESLSRYVTIGISCDVSENVRACKLEVKSGTAATTPVIPTFEDTAIKKFLTLAAVFLKGGTKSITNDDIFDIREDESKCGYVKCVLGKCRVSEILMALSNLYAQLLAEIKKIVSEGGNGINGTDGENGLSAYELAVQNGFTGTLTEWLNSLKGADGINGINGKNGIDGKNGLSAYEIAVKNGFVGTESEWLDSLKGENGTEIDLSKYVTQTSLIYLQDSLKRDISAQQEQIESLSKKSHTHNNQSALDEITAERIEKWDNAPEYVDNQIKNFKTEIHGNLHQHKNLAVLDSITAESVSEWNNCVEKLSGVEIILAKIVEVSE